MNKTIRIAREAALWSGAALGSLCLLALVAGWLFNVTPLVFSSGSMSPAYDAGALGIAREVPADELVVGDVVSVVNAEGVRVTHRIVDLQMQGDGALLSLQGDTNNVADAELYPVTSADRVGFGLPYAGYALNAAASPFGLLVVGLFVIGVLWLGFGRRDDDADAPVPSRARRLVPVGIAGVVLAGTGLGVSGQAPWAFTSAFWTDTATATATASTPAVAAGPPVTCSVVGTNGNWRIKLDWIYSPDPSTGFVVRSTGPVPGTPATLGPAVRTWTSGTFASVGGQIWVVAVEGVTEIESNKLNYNFGPGSGNGNKLCPSP